MGVDVDKPYLDFRDPVRIMREVGFAQQGVALEVRLEHDFKQAFRPIRCFLCKAAHAPARRDGDSAGLSGQFGTDGLEQRRFAGPVAADQPDARAGNDLRGAMIDEEPSGDPHRYIGD